MNPNNSCSHHSIKIAAFQKSQQKPGCQLGQSLQYHHPITIARESWGTRHISWEPRNQAQSRGAKEPGTFQGSQNSNGSSRQQFNCAASPAKYCNADRISETWVILSFSILLEFYHTRTWPAKLNTTTWLFCSLLFTRSGSAHTPVTLPTTSPHDDRHNLQTNDWQRDQEWQADHLLLPLWMLQYYGAPGGHILGQQVRITRSTRSKTTGYKTKSRQHRLTT